MKVLIVQTFSNETLNSLKPILFLFVFKIWIKFNFKIFSHNGVFVVFAEFEKQVLHVFFLHFSFKLSSNKFCQKYTILSFTHLSINFIDT